MSNPSFIDIHSGFGATVAARDWDNPQAIRQTLQMRGIGMAFLTSLSSRRYDLPTGNDALANALPRIDDASDAPGVRGWLIAHPARTADSVLQMRRHLSDERFVGLALYPDPLTGTPVLARNSTEVVTAFRRYAKPILVHAPSAAAMYEVVRLAADFSGVKIIASGMGGEEWHEAIEMSVKPLNLYLDISGALSAEKLDYAQSAMGGVRKLMFASGAPGTDPAAVLAMLFESNLSEEDRAKVLYTNAQRFLGFPLPEEEAPSLAPMGG